MLNGNYFSLFLCQVQEIATKVFKLHISFPVDLWLSASVYFQLLSRLMLLL